MYMDKILMTVLISMAPVAELRAAIPFAVTHDLNPWLIYVLVVIGNMIPVPFILGQRSEEVTAGQFTQNNDSANPRCTGRRFDRLQPQDIRPTRFTGGYSSYRLCRRS